MQNYAVAAQKFLVEEILGGDEPSDLNNDTLLVEEGLIDSLGIFDMVAWMEETYGFEMEAEDVTIDNFKSLTNIATFISARLS